MRFIYYDNPLLASRTKKVKNLILTEFKVMYFNMTCRCLFIYLFIYLFFFVLFRIILRFFFPLEENAPERKRLVHVNTFELPVDCLASRVKKVKKSMYMYSFGRVSIHLSYLSY